MADDRIRESFSRQQLMQTLGAEIVGVSEGEVRIRLPASAHISQQHGFAHAGAMAAIADSACGYACLTKMPEDAAVLTVEFKINLMAPPPESRFWRSAAPCARAGPCRWRRRRFSPRMRTVPASQSRSCRRP